MCVNVSPSSDRRNPSIQPTMFRLPSYKHEAPGTLERCDPTTETAIRDSRGRIWEARGKGKINTGTGEGELVPSCLAWLLLQLQKEECVSPSLRQKPRLPHFPPLFLPVQHPSPFILHQRKTHSNCQQPVLCSVCEESGLIPAGDWFHEGPGHKLVPGTCGEMERTSESNE